MSTYQNHINFVSVTPTVDTAAYADGDLMGTKMTFSNALPLETGCGLLRSVRISDLAGQTGAFDLVLFESDPSGTTFTDNAAFDIADTDLSKVMCVINFPAASQFAFADNSVKYLTGMQTPIRGISTNAPSRTIYGALVARAAQTYATASDVTVKLGITFT